MKLQRAFIGMLIAVLALTAAYSAYGSTAPTTAGKVRVITIRMGEFYFRPATIRLKAGERVRFVFINNGKLEHEFMLGNGMFMKENGQIHGFMNDFFKNMKPKFSGTDAKYAVEMTGTEVEVDPGGRASLTFTVPASKKGKWTYGCFVPGHFQAGQKGTLTVTK